MKRLLKIGLDIATVSLLPIWMWIILGITIDTNLANVFIVMYPMQFIYMIIDVLFGEGANIVKYKYGLNEKNA